MIMPRDSCTVPTPAALVHIRSPLRWLLRRNSSRSGRQNSSRSPVNTGPPAIALTGMRLVVAWRAAGDGPGSSDPLPGAAGRPATVGGVGGLLRVIVEPLSGRVVAPPEPGGRSTPSGPVRAGGALGVGDGRVGAGLGRTLAIGVALPGSPGGGKDGPL